jgi:hypothetical protein
MYSYFKLEKYLKLCWGEHLEQKRKTEQEARDIMRSFLIKKLIFFQMVMKLRAFCVTQMFIIMFTRARHWTVFCVSGIDCTSLYALWDLF